MIAMKELRSVDRQLDYADTVAQLWLGLADRAFAREDLESCLRYAHLAATVYSRQNRVLFCPRIEALTRSVASRLFDQGTEADRCAGAPASKSSALHVLTEALPAGGLTAMASRWINSDAGRTTGHVALLTTDVQLPSALADAVALSGGAVHTLPADESFCGKAIWLRRLAHRIADVVVLHIDVSDVVCATAFGSPGGPPVILVNHTAHTFWVGTGYVDRIANCRGSALEAVWAKKYRGTERYSTIPIPLSPELLACSTPRGQTNQARAEIHAAMALPENATVLVTVGARFKYSPLPNLDFLKTIETVLQAAPSALLLVVGFQPDERWQQAIARANGRIRVLGILRQDELSRVFNASDIYVEGFPFGTTTALLEAACSGTAVALAPSDCPPPYSTDGIAIDDVIGRAPSIDEYIRHLVSLVEDAAARSQNAASIGASVRRHHFGDGWAQHLRTAVAALPPSHETYEVVATPVRTPESIYAYWARCSLTWTWSHDETLEHMLLRALHLELRPHIDRESRELLRTASGRASAKHMPHAVVAFISNTLLPCVPLRARARVFRLASFVFRPDLLGRLRQLAWPRSGRRPRTGAYDEYRQVAPRSSSAG